MQFEIPIEKSLSSVQTVKIGATKDEGGTRTSTVTIGGATALNFHHFEGKMPYSPVIAMEVFDTPPPRYPATLLGYYGDVIDKPGVMAKKCVEEYGAQMISVRLDG